MNRAQILAVALLVILAGCGGSVQDTTTTTPATTATTATTPTSTTTSTTTTTTTSTTRTPTTTPAPDNPWEADVVTVAVDDSLEESQDISPLVNETLAYWNEHASTYGDYAVEFQYTTDTLRADIVVELVREIPECGPEQENETVGCAPLLETGTDAAAQETVEVVAGYTDETTRQILKHEFGHVLGIEHGEEPMPTMRAWTDTTYLEKPNATERALPWENDTLTVYLSTENRTYTDTVTEQVEHALSYYERGADGHVPENVSFVMTDNESAADVTVSFPTAVTCGGTRETSGSCGWLWGYDTDTDDALEYYYRAEIRVAHQTDPEAVGWHVGAWLADAFGLISDEELPPPFVDPDYDTVYGEWWK